MNLEDPYYLKVFALLSERYPKEHKAKTISFQKQEQHTKAAMANNMASNRKLANLSQAQVAKSLGVSLSQYKKYESGLDTMRIDVAQRWSMVFSQPVFHLLQGSEFEQYLPSIKYDKELNYLWCLANSLTDKYFSILLNNLLQFASGQHANVASFSNSGITQEKMTQVRQESQDNIYVAIAYGLRAMRDYFSWSQEYTAAVIGVSLSTYQDYEKPEPFPRFSVLVSARFTVATQIDPLIILGATHYSEVRKMQNARLELVRSILDDIDPILLLQIRPLIDGFSKSVTRIPEARLTILK
ncbi:MAG: helix-turn-helix transcriptional regulator [Agarilytica sp.]